MNIETMRLLVSKGLSADDLLEIAEAMAVKTDPTAAERQARYRERKAVERDAVTRDVTRDSDAVTPPSLSRPPNELKSNPPTHTHPESLTPRARKGHRLPVDWEPRPLTGEIAAAVETWPVGAMERELARFRDWAASATGQVAVKADWDAAWRNWLRKANDEGRYGRSEANRGISAGNSRDCRDGIAKALDRRLGLDGAPREIGRRDPEGVGPDRLLGGPVATAVRA